MTTVGWRAHLHSALEGIAHVLLHAPDSPAEDETSVEQEVGEIESCLASAEDRLESGDRLQWIKVARCELEPVARLFREGEVEKAFVSIQSAEAHIRNALKGAKVRSRFVTGPDGSSLDLGD